MVRRVYPGRADFENLSALRTEGPGGSPADAFDFSRVVVNKPWGHEYLWFQNSSVAVWMLRLEAGRSTSMHCHARKRTSLVVMEGEVECSTFEHRHALRPGDALVIEPCAFHSTRARSPGGALVMEVENPPLKGDLLRYRDEFGRAGQGYEAPQAYSEDLARYDHRPLTPELSRGGPFRLGSVWLHHCATGAAAGLAELAGAGGVLVPVLGRLVFGRDVVADIGQAVAADRLPLGRCPPAFAPVEALGIRPA